MKIDEIKHIKGRRSVGILVKDGKVYVRAPRNIPDSKLNSVLKEKESWINRKLKEYNLALELNRDIIEYKRFLYLGERNDYIGGRFCRSGSIKDPPNCGPLQSAAMLKKIEKEYKKRAAAALPEILHNISGSSGLGYNSLKLTGSKAKWGSCNNKGVITLNWRLMMLPQSIIEYIVLHELCHLKNMNHSKEYWQTLEKYYPDVKGAKQYLKANNYIIKLF